MAKKKSRLSSRNKSPYDRFMSDKEYFITLKDIPGPDYMQGYGGSSTSIYIDENNGQPYEVSIRGTGCPAGESTLVGERMKISGSPRRITYEELIALTEKAYPGIGQRYEGINEANWRDYRRVYSYYLAMIKMTEGSEKAYLTEQLAEMKSLTIK